MTRMTCFFEGRVMCREGGHWVHNKRQVSSGEFRQMQKDAEEVQVRWEAVTAAITIAIGSEKPEILVWG